MESLASEQIVCGCPSPHGKHVFKRTHTMNWNRLSTRKWGKLVCSGGRKVLSLTQQALDVTKLKEKQSAGSQTI